MDYIRLTYRSIIRLLLVSTIVYYDYNALSATFPSHRRSTPFFFSFSPRISEILRLRDFDSVPAPRRDVVTVFNRTLNAVNDCCFFAEPSMDTGTEFFG